MLLNESMSTGALNASLLDAAMTKSISRGALTASPLKTVWSTS